MKRPARKLAGFLVYEKLLPREGWRKGDEGPCSMVTPKVTHLFLHPFNPRQGAKKGGRHRTQLSDVEAPDLCDTKCINDLGQGLPPG